MHCGRPALPCPALAPPAGVVEPESLEVDEASEDELEGLAGLPPRASAAGSASASPDALPPPPPDELRAQRFLLLRDLWAAAAR